MASGYKEPLMVIFGYNKVILNEHINAISRTDAWGTNTELTILSLLTGVDIQFICGTTSNLDTWASRPIHICTWSRHTWIKCRSYLSKYCAGCYLSQMELQRKF